MNFNDDVLVNLNKLTQMTVTVQILPLVDGQGELLATFGGTLAKVAEGDAGDWYLWFEKGEGDGKAMSILTLREDRVRDAYWPDGVTLGSQFNVVHGDILIALKVLLPESAL